VQRPSPRGSTTATVGSLAATVCAGAWTVARVRTAPNAVATPCATRSMVRDEVSAAEFDRVFAINTRVPLLAIQYAAWRMSAGGRIINVSSVSTSWPGADEILYAASKDALEQLTRVASRALGSRQITVNTVSPGTTDTEFLRTNVPEESGTPLPR
jgi:NAD(P)-dependent dehydrogenase (short-subunit alcohol dehydrogenase family)